MNLKKEINNEIYIILCTINNCNLAHSISEILLKKKLAACINILPKITSFYYWNNVLNKKFEIQMIIKTTNQIKHKTIAEIKKNHPYKIPEILLIKVNEIDDKYLSWINLVLKK